MLTLFIKQTAELGPSHYVAYIIVIISHAMVQFRATTPLSNEKSLFQHCIMCCDGVLFKPICERLNACDCM